MVRLRGRRLPEWDWCPCGRDSEPSPAPSTLSVRKQVLPRHQICWCLGRGLRASGTVRTVRRPYCLQAISLWYFCPNSQSKLRWLQMMSGKGLVIYTYSSSQWMNTGMAILDLIRAPPAVAAVQWLSCVQLHVTSWATVL